MGWLHHSVRGPRGVLRGGHRRSPDCGGTGDGRTAHQALSRPLTPDDTAAVVAMLASDEAAALTGQTLTVDGGLVLR